MGWCGQGQVFHHVRNCHLDFYALDFDVLALLEVPFPHDFDDWESCAIIWAFFGLINNRNIDIQHYTMGKCASNCQRNCPSNAKERKMM